MRITVEFDMVDMSMWKHIELFKIILKKFGHGITGIRILNWQDKPYEIELD